MPLANPTADVYTAREIAAAAGVPAHAVHTLLANGALPTVDGRFVGSDDAVEAVRLLRGRGVREHGELFRPHEGGTKRSSGRALAASGAAHLALLSAVLLTTLQVTAAPGDLTPLRSMKLVFLQVPGTGGGGGGGGVKQPEPASRAALAGPSVVPSPVPPPRTLTSRPPEPRPVATPPPRPAPTSRPTEPEPVAKPVVPPQVAAPVVTAPADTRDRAGVVTEPGATSESQGPGAGGGAGTGRGTGLGEGDGSGIGAGSGGGTGGGPYRAGAGITPPALIHEVKPDYAEDARRRGLTGDVLLEIVVQRDGTVGDVRVLQGLGGGLDQRAVTAVRAWRFSPARRFGAPVDVLVEVAIEFKLR